MTDDGQVRFIGRYAMHAELASGGMATVHLGRLLGPVGFARTVAIKRLHAQYAKDPHFVAMFVDEARIAARIRHPNVVPTLDVVAGDGEIHLVMEYVHGESLSRLLAASEKRGERVPPAIAARVIIDVLQGLHAAHEARTEKGVALEIVHRDVSPQNVLVGTDGSARVLDFGIAKAVDRLQTTEDGSVKGKIAYAAPEQLEGHALDRRADIWASAVVFWELLVGRRLFAGPSAAAIVHDVLMREVPAPSEAGSTAPELDAVVMRGLRRAPAERFASAREMALAIEAAITPASARAVGEWVESTAGATLASRASRVEEMESEGGGSRTSDESLRRQLAVLGVTAGAAPTPTGTASRAQAPADTSEEPTGAAPGRIARSDAPPAATAASAPPPDDASRRAPVDAEPEPASPRPSTWRRASAVALAAVGLAALAVVASRRSEPSDRPQVSSPTNGPTPASVTRAQATSGSAAATSATTLASGAATTSTAPESSAPASNGPTGPAASSTTTRPAPAAPLVRSARPATTALPERGHAAPSCDPPYTVGPAPDFIRVPKPECLPP